MNRQPGFTLIELMVTLAVAAILMTVGIPTFRDLLIRNKLTTYTNDLVGAINYARSEAITRGQTVSLCKSSSGTTCTTTTGSQWENGWIAFADVDADGSLDSGDTLLRMWPALTAPYTLRPSTIANFLRYDGRGAANDVGVFAICHNNTLEGSKALTITGLRPRLGIDTNNDDIPEKDKDGGSENIGSCEDP